MVRGPRYDRSHPATGRGGMRALTVSTLETADGLDHR